MNRSRTRLLLNRLNGSWHKRANLVLLTIVVGHWVEHVMQAYQVYALNESRPHAHGAIGMLFPWLVTSEWLHYGYVGAILAGLVVLRPGFSGRGRVWWNAAVAIQSWHFIEHSLLLAQAILGHNLFGAGDPTSLLQLVAPRLELHLFYNAVGFIPMIIGLLYHLFPPSGEWPVCRCADSAGLLARNSVRSVSH